MQQANEAERSQKISLTDTVRTWAALHDSNAPVSLAVLRERERERERMPGPRTDSNSSVGLVADGIYLLAKNVSGWARPVLGVQRVAPVRLRLHLAVFQRPGHAEQRQALLNLMVLQSERQVGDLRVGTVLGDRDVVRGRAHKRRGPVPSTPGGEAAI